MKINGETTKTLTFIELYLLKRIPITRHFRVKMSKNFLIGLTKISRQWDTWFRSFSIKMHSLLFLVFLLSDLWCFTLISPQKQNHLQSKYRKWISLPLFSTSFLQDSKPRGKNNYHGIRKGESCITRILVTNSSIRFHFMSKKSIDDRYLRVPLSPRSNLARKEKDSYRYLRRKHG